MRLPAARFLPILPLVLLLFAGCSREFSRAVGPNQDISLFSDFPVGDERTALVRGFLEQPIAAPVRAEVPYRIERPDSTGFGMRRAWRNLVFVADMNSSTWSARRCRDVLGPARSRSLADAPAGYAFVPDVWADGQTVLFVHAADDDALRGLLAAEGERIRARLEELVITGLGKTLFISDEQTEVADGIQRRHGYRLRIPGDFLVEEQTENRFVRLKRIVPDEPVMFFFVYYQEQMTDTLSGVHCMAIRDTLSAVYFGADRIDQEHTTVRRRQFLEHDAIEIYGRYQNFKPPMGGPFKTICFHQGGRLYLIDLAVFNPPGSKMPQLRILEAMARTFIIGRSRDTP